MKHDLKEVDVIGGLVASSVLIDLDISIWVGRKTDKAATQKVVSDSNATSRDAANVTKNLFVGNAKLEEITRRAAKARAYVADHSLPWMGDMRLLPMATFIRFQEDMNILQNEFYAAVDDFLDGYDIQVSAMAFKLGKLFNRAEYPDSSSLRHRFKMTWSVMPLPTSGDFRVDAEETLKRHLHESYQEAMQERIEASMKMLWDRLRSCLEHLLDRLGTSEDGKLNVFRNTMLENANELLLLLKDMNIGQDAQMEQVRQQLHSIIHNVEPDELRTNKEIREDVRANVKDILDKFRF